MARRSANAKAAVSIVKPQASGPKSSKGVRTRERLVEAAKEIFEEHGFLEARISDISERAGQSHGSFYYYFDSKEEVFREVAATIDAQLFAPLEDVIKAPSNLPPRLRIREAMRRYLKSYREGARIVGMIEHVSRYDPEVNAMRLARHKRNTERVASTIRYMQRAKVADPKLDPAIVAAALGALTDRFSELWLVQGAIECSFDHAVEQLCRLFENAVGIKYPPNNKPL